jgi:hypothetical protein
LVDISANVELQCGQVSDVVEENDPEGVFSETAVGEGVRAFGGSWTVTGGVLILAMMAVVFLGV